MSQNHHLTEWIERDKWGRTCRYYAVDGKPVAVRVTLPKVHREMTGMSHMTTNLLTGVFVDYRDAAEASSAAKALQFAAVPR